MGVTRTGAALALVGCCALAAGANADPTDRAELTVTLANQAPAQGTALTLKAVYRDPANPDGKPSPIERVVVDLPAGTRIATAALPQCGASDDELRVRGRGACPEESKVGTGKLVAYMGTPADPVQADVTVFNNRDELVEVVTAEGTDRVLGMDRLHVEGSRLTGNPPSTPGGPPDGRTAIAEIGFELPARTGSGGTPYVRTPPSCPDGRWTSRGEFGFADGSTAVATSVTPCRRDPSRLGATPRRVRAGQVSRVVIRALPSSRACSRGATVSFAGRRARTDATGRAALRVRPRRPGLARATLRKRGCRALATRLRVLPLRR